MPTTSANSFGISEIQHVSFVVSNTARSLGFYRDILGLQIDTCRPDLGFPGAWLKIDGGQQIHLLEVDNADPVTGRPEHGGRDRHTAFVIEHFDRLVSSLKAGNISYTLSRSGRKALFVRDPDGNTLEFISASR